MFLQSWESVFVQSLARKSLHLLMSEQNVSALVTVCGGERVLCSDVSALIFPNEDESRYLLGSILPRSEVIP